jgi:hypothetical protein
VGGLGRHHQHALTVRQRAVYDAYVGDDSPVGVVDRIEDQCPSWGGRITNRCRYLGNDLIQQVRYALPRLRRYPEYLIGITAHDLCQFGGVLVRLRTRQIDLVEDWNDVQVRIYGEVEVGQRLGFNTLRGIDEEYCAFAGGQRSGHLVSEVHMAWGIDHVEYVGLSGARVVLTIMKLPWHPDRLGLDRDAALSLNVHPI